MLTEKTPNFKILKITPNSIICQNTHNQHQFIYRELSGNISLATQQRLTKLFTIAHPNIVQLQHMDIVVINSQNHIQYTNTFPQNCIDRIKVGLYIQKYGNSLTQYLKSGIQSPSQYSTIGDLSPEQIINTFSPITQALEYLQAHGLLPRTISPNNIVLFDDGTIKYLDEALNNNPPIFNKEKENSYSIYLQLSELIYELLVPECSLKSWKHKIKSLKSRVSKEQYCQFMRVYNKSIPVVSDSCKTKRICKQNKINKTKKSLRSSKKFNKQNQVFQEIQ